MTETEQTPAISVDQYWVNLARDAYTGSSTWFDTNVRDRVINDIRQFQGEHPEGSKYLTDSYRLKSKMFRPKTRTAVLKKEATAAEEYFATEDVVAIRACDDDDPTEVIAAKIHKALLQYRLTRPHPIGLPWFLTLMGGVQDAFSVGVVCSYQTWKVDASKRIDRPDITLLPVENYRFDAAADWRDVVNSSPYFIIRWPMYVKDVRARMDKPEASEPAEAEGVEQSEEAAPRKPWKFYEDAQIKSATSPNDTIRQSREKGTDSKESTTLSDFAIAWVHENFIEVDGEDVVYFTLGTEHLLSDPIPVVERYPQGRPVVVGFSIVEAHKTYKPSICTLTKEIQGEINDVANLRMDNVKLRLRPRSLVKRGAQADLRALTRGVPGAVILVNNVDGDVKPILTEDATSSSYQEQDRLNNDFDDMAGAFSGSSVATNRRLNETVGGMEMLNANSDKVSAYQLRTITETWVEPTLRQLMMLIQHYETDPVALKYAAKQAGIDIPAGTKMADLISEEMMMKDTILNVGVGTGSTNPQKKVERFSFGIETMAKLFGADFAQKANQEEISKELFGSLGYKDGQRFFTTGKQEDPRIAELTQTIQQLQQAMAAKNPPELVAAQVAKLEAESNAIKVKAMLDRVEALFAAMNTAEKAVMIPGVMPVADGIAASAGFEDQDAPPIYPEGAGGAFGPDSVSYEEGLANARQLAGVGVQPIDGAKIASSGLSADRKAGVPQNTSPMFPPQAANGMMQGVEGGGDGTV